MIEPVYRYRADLVRVITGDSCLLRIDLGFHAALTLTIRFRDYDAPDITTTRGLKAMAAASVLLTKARTIIVESYWDEQSFTRWLADVWVDGISIAEELTKRGHVKAPTTTA